VAISAYTALDEDGRAEAARAPARRALVLGVSSAEPSRKPEPAAEKRAVAVAGAPPRRVARILYEPALRRRRGGGRCGGGGGEEDGGRVTRERDPIDRGRRGLRVDLPAHEEKTAAEDKAPVRA
jgi:hypothetical protein